MNLIKMVSLLIISASFLIGCDKDDAATLASSTFTIIVECTAAADCGDNSADGKTIDVGLADPSQTCLSPPSTFTATGTGTVSCTGGTCAATITSWTSVPTSTHSVIFAIDTDGDGEAGGTGEPLGCQNGISVSNGGSVTVNEASLDGSSGWTDAS